MTDYAIVKTGGKQYRVEVGDTLRVELLPSEAGSTVELDDVLLVARGGDVVVGQPRVEGARVVAQVQGHGKAEKVIAFKFKNKTHYMRKKGHRQPYTELKVQEIAVGGSPAGKAKPRRATRARKKELPEEAQP